MTRRFLGSMTACSIEISKTADQWRRFARRARTIGVIPTPLRAIDIPALFLKLHLSVLLKEYGQMRSTEGLNT